jgi:hypothetical protein
MFNKIFDKAFDPKVIYTPAHMLIMCKYITIMVALLFTVVFVVIAFTPSSNLLRRRPPMDLMLGLMLGALSLLCAGYILNGHSSFYKMFNPKIIFNSTHMSLTHMFFISHVSNTIMLISYVVSITLLLKHKTD